MIVAGLVLLLWGNTLVIRFVQNMGANVVERVALEVDETVSTFTGIGNNLAADPAVLRAVSPDTGAQALHDDLELYEQIFQAVRGHLSETEVHLVSSDGMKRYSSTEFPRRYDLRDFQVRENFSSQGGDGPRLLLAPGPGSEGNQIVFTIWFPLSHGILFVDVRAQALEAPLQNQMSSRIFLVDRREFITMNVVQPHDPASFSETPELGIVFTNEYISQASPNQLVHRVDLSADDLSVIMITDLATYFDTLQQILLLVITLAVGISAVTMIVSIRISRSISRPIDSIIDAMTRSPKGPLPLPEPFAEEPRDELEQLTFHYNSMVETIESLIQRIREEEHLLRNAERKALQAQIQPHFLYNTLGSIKSMAKLGDAEAVTAIVTDLGKILRYSLSDTEAMVPLKEITDLVQRYFNIQKIRFQDRMNVITRLDTNAQDIRVPKLILEPLAENAVIHGVETCSRPVEITLSTRLSRKVLEIRVEDTGPGLHEPEIPSEGHGIGLKNVEKRLGLIYGEQAEFKLFQQTEKTVAMIRIFQ